MRNYKEPNEPIDLIPMPSALLLQGAAGSNLIFTVNNPTTGGKNFTADQTGSNSFINITAIPEPRAAVLGSLGLLALRRRRRR